ncbi:MAG: hypothetical protein HYR72_08820 [Deltaproteobacteria bacterium]|nr:hypothetical protein [Deltaproteobacteria bacterium]MBI3388857.1 hypothetical protein [Deltaproteobacteria bacterium]
MTTTKKTPKSGLPGLPKQLATVRHDVEKAARRAWDQAVELLPAAPRKAMRNFTHEFERAANDLRKRVDRTRAEVEKRGEQLVATATERAEKALNPMVRRLDVASRTEVDKLRKRVAQLERRVTTPSHSSPVA